VRIRDEDPLDEIPARPYGDAAMPAALLAHDLATRDTKLGSGRGVAEQFLEARFFGDDRAKRRIIGNRPFERVDISVVVPRYIEL
jgi:hypothetical protein